MPMPPEPTAWITSYLSPMRYPGLKKRRPADTNISISLETWRARRNARQSDRTNVPCGRRISRICLRAQGPVPKGDPRGYPGGSEGPSMATDAGEGRSVLVVDDDDDIRTAVQEVLEEKDYPTVGASNGREALDLLRTAENLPALVLLDLMMPEM